MAVVEKQRQKVATMGAVMVERAILMVRGILRLGIWQLVASPERARQLRMLKHFLFLILHITLPLEAALLIGM